MSRRTIPRTVLALSCLALAAGPAAAAPPERIQTEEEESQPRGWLGVSIQDSEDGVQVVDVRAEGPAARAGIQGGDVVVSIDGAAVEAFADLRRALEQTHVGETVSVGVRRGEDDLRFAVTLGEREGAPGRLARARLPDKGPLADLLRKREEFERSWRADFEAELERMRQRFDDGSRDLADQLRKRLDDRGEARGPDAERLRAELERWRHQRLEGIERLRAGLRAWNEPFRLQRDGDDDDAPDADAPDADDDEEAGNGWQLFRSPGQGWAWARPYDGDQLHFRWPNGWSGPAAPMAPRGPDLGELRSSVEDLREEVRRLRSQLEDLRERRDRSAR